MTRGSGTLQKSCGPASGQNNKDTKNRHVLEGVTKPCLLIGSSKRNVKVDGEEPCYERVSSGHPSAQLSPQPPLLWGSSEDVWVRMIGQEQNHRHSKGFLQRHPQIQPRTRSILLDWLMEVSETYSLRRQTFYLAQDYFDRFMLTQSNVDKSVLQLIGTTCLFIASKMEEACPPKVSQMAHVTADTFYKEEILQMELIILKALRWNLCPDTALSWLKLYFRMASMNPTSDLPEPQFPPDVFPQMTRLLDLCILHINSLDFQYRALAASVLSHFVNQETVKKVSGLPDDAIQPCVKWMTPIVQTLRWFGRVPQRGLATVQTEDQHNIQTHTDYMRMLEQELNAVALKLCPSLPEERRSSMGNDEGKSSHIGRTKSTGEPPSPRPKGHCPRRKDDDDDDGEIGGGGLCPNVYMSKKEVNIQFPTPPNTH